MSVQQIRTRLEAILEYMQPHWEFVNCHMVNFLTDRHWDCHVPTELRVEVPEVQQVQRCIATVFWQRGVEERKDAAELFPAYSSFLHLSESHRLQHFSELLTSEDQLKESLGSKHDQHKISIKEFMSEKKGHEVEVTAELVDDMIRNNLDTTINEIYVVDAGDGKGYLSSRLALQYGHKVLGLDANVSNTENALKRSKKLERVWEGLTTRAELERQGLKPPRRGKKANLTENQPKLTATNSEDKYRTSSSFITTDLNILKLLDELFPTHTLPPALCLTGLHTCGNLAPTCLRLFHAQTHCKLLCNVGCCYHLLKESYSEQEFFGNKLLMATQMEEGFPMSQFLHGAHIKLGRNARMLAAQSIDRTLASQELPNVSLYYRALLEVLICEQDENLKDTVRVGKIRKFETFMDYLSMCVKKTSFNLESLNADQVEQIELQYADQKHYLNLFYLLRMSFAPVLESLILLDRLLYLKELGYEHSYLVPLFDAVISPRRFAIVALK